MKYATVLPEVEKRATIKRATVTTSVFETCFHRNSNKTSDYRTTVWVLAYKCFPFSGILEESFL